MRTIAVWVLSIAVLGLNGCAGSAPVRKTFVAPGELFAGGYINVRAPTTPGWQIMQSSGSGMAFAKEGQALQNESFVAQVSMFNLVATSTPAEFQALIKTSIEQDTDPSRFTVQKASYELSNERSYPCVRYSSVTEDNAAPKAKSPLLLQVDALYCRHPVRTDTGFAVTYSHRGAILYANLRSEAEGFIQGVQVPEK